MSAECAALYAEVDRLLKQRRLIEAAQTCKRLCERCPDFGAAWYAGSIVARDLNNPAKAFEYIDRAIALSPARVIFRLHKAQLLLAQRRVAEAEALVGSVAGECRDDGEALSALGVYYLMKNAHELASGAFQRATELAPLNARHWINLAATRRFLGNAAESEAAYDRGLALEPEDFEAWLMRAGLRRQTRERNHVEELTARLARKPEWPGEVQLCHALAKELEDLGEYARSFAYLRRGASVRRAHLQYDVGRDLKSIEAIIATYSHEICAQAPAGYASDEPIFIVGLPRTGTTLVERILSSHSQVYSAGELNNFALELTALLATQMHGAAVPKDEQIARSVTLDFRQLGENYVASTRPETGHTARFLDKMPLNSLYCGLIAVALPRARIVEVVRDPMDTCYAIYKQLFTTAYPYSYDLVELAHYYLAHRKLMSHWHAVLPGRIHQVRYETLVEDQLGETRKLLAHCGLAWEEACMRFEQNPQASTTASAMQIRKPIYRSSIGQWRNYEAGLEPLAHVLRTAGIQL